MSDPLQQRDDHTYADYLGWGDDQRFELIAGEALAMSPAPGLLHQAVSMGLSLQIGSFLQGGPCRVFAAPFDVRLPEANEADDQVRTVVQPDLSVICDVSKLDRAGCRGAPDWVVEIPSPATAAHDQIRKRELYASHGVQEFWLVHPSDALVWVYRQGPEEGFGAPAISEMKGQLDVATLPGLAIDWDVITASFPPLDES